MIHSLRAYGRNGAGSNRERAEGSLVVRATSQAVHVPFGAL